MTAAPAFDGFALLASEVVVGDAVACAAATAAAALTMPAPQSVVVHWQVNQPELEPADDDVVTAQAGAPTGNARAVVCKIDSTCAGVSPGAIESMSDATPVTCGAAMLVPWYCL